LIIDAGGGTVDISIYRVLGNGPLQVEELYEPSCESGPSRWQIFRFNNIRLGLSPRRRACYGEGNSDDPRCVLTLYPQTDCSTHNQRSLAAFSQRFDEGVKKVFSMSNSHTDQYVRFGSPRDNDLNYGIRAGRLTLTG